MIIAPTPASSSTPASILAKSTDWRTGVTDLVAWMVANDRCFSSGEVTAYLRTYRSDLRFAATGIGEFIREWYEGTSTVGPFPSYDDGAGGTVYPTQVPRTTVGTSRTLDGRTVASKSPIGVTVFVYAKDGNEGFAHDFEVYIPDFDDPNALKAAAPSAPMLAAAQAATAPVVTSPSGATSRPPTPAVGVLITGSLKRDDLTAYVRPVDCRLCVPRAAFEAFVSLTGVPLRGGPQGDPVYIDVVNNVARITRAPETSTATEYHLWTARGRVAFSAPTGTPPFTPGDKYEVKVDADALTIDLSTKV